MESRRETTKIRTSDRYLREKVAKAAKLVESDEGYNLGYDEMMVFVKAVRALEDLKEVNFA